MAVVRFRRTWATRPTCRAECSPYRVGGTVCRHAIPSRCAASLRQVGDPLPPGAASCRQIYTEITTPFDAGARGTPLTSCAFVEQVRRTAKADHLSTSMPPTQVRVVSPITRKQYEMQCISAVTYLTCTGGEDAVVYLYSARR